MRLLLITKACFTLIVRPIVRALLPQVTERRDREADRRQFYTESQDVRQPYDVRTIISRHMQGCRKTVMQNLQDCRKKKKRYGVRFLHCSRAVIVRFSAVVIRFPTFLRQPCDKAHGYLAVVLRPRKTYAWLANYYVSRTNTLRVLQQSCVSCSCLTSFRKRMYKSHRK